jgi:hypothetical protein
MNLFDGYPDAIEIALMDLAAVPLPWHEHEHLQSVMPTFRLCNIAAQTRFVEFERLDHLFNHGNNNNFEPRQ